MKLNVKNLISYLLTATVSLSCFPVTAVYGEASVQSNTESISQNTDKPLTDNSDVVNLIYSDDMENDSPEVGTYEGNVYYKEVDSEHSKSLVIDSSTGTHTVTFRFDGIYEEPLMEIVSFEMYSTINNISAYVNLYQDTLRGCIWRHRNDAKTTYATNYAGQDAKLRLDRPLNKWVRYDVALDYQNRVTYYYVDGEQVAENPMKDDMKYFDRLCYTIQKEDGAGGAHYIDNLNVLQIKKAGQLLNLPYDISYPKEIEEYVTINTNRLGSIYFGNKLDFTLEMFNSNEKTKNYEIETWIKTETGLTSEKKKQIITLNAGEKKDVVITHDSLRYGFSDFYMQVTETDTGRVSKGQKAFSVVNPPPEGVRNPKQWLGDSSRGGQGYARIEDKYKLFADAGFSGFRSGSSWAYFERERGVYKFDSRNKVSNEMHAKYGLDWLCLLAYENPIVTRERPPKSDAAIKGFADYAYNMTLQAKELGFDVSFEVWNEWNCPAFNTNGATPEDYVRLLKATYEAIKRANPNAKVGGLGGPTYILGERQGEKWIEDCMKAGAGEYCDFFTVHPYGPMYVAQYTIDQIDCVNEIFERYGYGDKPVVATETGYSSNLITEWQQMTYTLQQSTVSYDDMEQFCWYINQEKQDLNADGTENKGECHFGWIRPWDEEYAAPYETYSAKPVFIAMTNHNRIMANAEALGKQETVDEDINMYMFKGREGNSITIAWHGDENYDGTVGFEVGVPNVTVCDAYGNETVYATINGVLNLNLTGEPLYIIGDYSDIKQTNTSFDINVQSLNITTDDTTSVYITKAVREEMKISITAPSNITVEENNGFSNENQAKLMLKTGLDKGEGEEVKVNITNEDGTKTYFATNLDVNYLDAVTVKSESEYFRTGRWRGVIKARNNKSGHTVKAEVCITKPEYIAKKVQKVQLEIPPLSEKEIVFNIPEADSDVKVTLEGEIELDNGEIYPIENDMYFSTIGKTKNIPTIDGVLEKGEWNFENGFKITSPSQVKGIKSYGGLDDLSGRVSMKFDNKRLYLAAKVTDNILGDKDSGQRLWACDSIQFAFTTERVAGGQRTEYAIGLLDGKPSIKRYALLGLDLGVLGVSDGEKFIETTEIAVRRDEENKITYYELSIPWAEIYGDKLNPVLKKSLYLSMLINDNDGSGRRGWMEYCPGIGTDKNPSLFIEVPVSVE